MKRNIIVSSILGGFLIISICLKTVWAGFKFFSLISLMFLCIYWLTTLIAYYFADYKLHFEEEFAEYRAEIINSKNITVEDFDQNQEVYIKKFKKSMRKYKLIDIGKILFVLSVLLVVLVAMARGNF